jgi:hypothetical protein
MQIGCSAPSGLSNLSTATQVFGLLRSLRPGLCCSALSALDYAVVHHPRFIGSIVPTAMDIANLIPAQDLRLLQLHPYQYTLPPNLANLDSVGLKPRQGT